MPMRASRAACVLAGLGVLALGQAHQRSPVVRGIIRGEADERELKGTRVVERVKRAEGSLQRFLDKHHAKAGVEPVKTSQLFDEPYRPADSRHFNVQASHTFRPDVAKKFDLSYADGTELSGFQGIDQVHLGDFHAMAPFGVITDCNSPDFNGVDGILGFGLPKPQYYGNALPRPILFALTDHNDDRSNTQHLPRKFSFFSTDTAAEVQLGGYDPNSIVGTMDHVPSLTHSDFSVPITSLTYGKPGGAVKELLQFKTPGASLPAIMDSGTSCLVIPSDTVYGKLKNKPWDDFVDQWAEDTSFFLTIHGKKYEIPYSSWYLADSEQTCVQPTPDGMDGLLVGDVFFREYIVEFDMINQNAPIIGIGQLNKHYQPVRAKTLDYSGLKEDGKTALAYDLKEEERHEAKAPKISKLMLTRGHDKSYPAQHTMMLAEIDRIPIVNKQGTQYFMDVTIGSPQQPFTVIFDTGSNVFGMFRVLMCVCVCVCVFVCVY